MILKITEAKVILGWRIILDLFTSQTQIGNRLRMLFLLPVAISPMEKRFEMSLPIPINILDTLRKVSNGIIKVHKPGMHEPSIEMVKPIIGFQSDCFFKFGEGIVDLVEHHHAVASIGVVLGLLVVESDGRTEVVHCFLVVSDCHERIAAVCVVFSVDRPFVACWSALQTGDGLAEFLDGSLSVLFLLFLVELFQ